MYTNIVYSPYLGGKFEVKRERFGFCFRFVTPPPNITGELHVGHVLNLVLQRIISTEWGQRGGRLQRVLGLDHAGLAVKHVLSRRRANVSAKVFWSWKRRIGSRVLFEIKRTLTERILTKIRFTLDKPFSMAVACAFVKLYRVCLVESKLRLLWWDNELDASVSKLEVNSNVNLKRVVMQRFVFEFGETVVWDWQDRVWFKTNYVLAEYVNAAGAVLLKLADLSLCKLKSANLINTVNGNKLKLIINVGTSEIGRCVNVNTLTLTHLPISLVCTSSTHLNSLTLKKNFTRANILAYVNVYYNTRTGSQVNRKLTREWFINLRFLLKYCNTTRVHFHPRRWKCIFNAWTSNLSLWCVSRRMNWGHNLPIWKLEESLEVRDTKLKAFYYLISGIGLPLSLRRAAGARLHSFKNLVFDTWFSSALWCLSCLGWPNKTKELKCAGGGIILTGYDIIFFWVLKMLLMSCFLVRNYLPFTNVVIHPIVCDASGQKMSKTKNNVINPRALFNSFGLETVRLYFSSVNLNTQQFKLCLNTLLSCRNVITKLWHSRKANIRSVQKTSNFCSAWMCKWTITSVFTRIKRVALSLHTFSTNLYLDTLLNLVKIDLNNLINLRASQCVCASTLYNFICWRYRAVLSRATVNVCLNTCYINSAVVASIIFNLTLVSAHSTLICTNSKRLLVQAQAPMLALALTNVYYLCKLRLNVRWQVFLLFNELFAWR
ncbi:Valine--tRNA ligase [Candidatus Hodgkinia cicadicola]|nr:Valine--tRNA ligase [Candidatus Hodgkinia cicadicola]